MYILFDTSYKKYVYSEEMLHLNINRRFEYVNYVHKSFALETVKDLQSKYIDVDKYDLKEGF